MFKVQSAMEAVGKHGACPDCDGRVFNVDMTGKILLSCPPITPLVLMCAGCGYQNKDYAIQSFNPPEMIIECGDQYIINKRCALNRPAKAVDAYKDTGIFNSYDEALGTLKQVVKSNGAMFGIYQIGESKPLIKYFGGKETNG